VHVSHLNPLLCGPQVTRDGKAGNASRVSVVAYPARIG
jgi:hypothetical protein